MRQWLEEILLEEIDPRRKLEEIQKDIKNDFEYKVKEMNKVTESLIK